MNKLTFYKFITALSCVCLLYQCSSNTEEEKSKIPNEGRLIINSGAVLPDVEDKYVYPIVPGTDVWNNISSTEELYQVSQLPDSVLQLISTLGLIRSILDIPALETFYWTSSNSSPVGTTLNILKHYNNATELTKRIDRSDALYIFNESVNISNINSLDEFEQRAISVQLTILEVLFTKAEIIDRFDFKQKQQIIALLLSRYNQIKQLNLVGFVNSGTITVIALIMYESKYAPLIQYYGDNLNFDYFNVLDEQTDTIITFANNFIND